MGETDVGRKQEINLKASREEARLRELKEIRLQVERNQVVRKERQAVTEIRLQPCSAHDNWSCACKRTRSKEQCQSRVKGIGPWV